MKAQFRLILSSIVLILLALAVTPVAARANTPWPTAGWQTSTPEAQGIDSVQLAHFLGNMTAMPDGFHSIVLIRHGDVVLDTSQYPFSSSKPQAFRDSSDPVISALIGIAIDKGLIQGVDQSIWDFLPKDQTANMDADKAALTIEDFLIHRSGLNFLPGEDFQQYYPLSGNNPSWLQVFLDGKMATRPGTGLVTWFYGDGLVLSAILQKASGMTTLDFARQNLFNPLGITDVTWLADPQGVTIGLDEIYLSPRDVAKILYLYLQKGQWAGQQIVSEAWVQTATSRLTTANESYGYGWTVDESGQYKSIRQLSAVGVEYGAFPELDLIYVVTGDMNFTITAGFPDNLLQVLGTATPLPENADALSALNAKVQALANPAPHDIRALPAVFKSASGKTYTLQENAPGWQSLALDFGAPGSTEATLTLGINGRPVKLTTGLDFVDRITPLGLPAQPASGAYRLIGDSPWMAKTNWIGQQLHVWMGDTMGRESWFVTLRFPAENQVSIQATMFGVVSPPATWNFTGTAN